MIHNIEKGETVYDQDGCKGVCLYEAEGNEYVHLSNARPANRAGGGMLPPNLSKCW